MDEIDQFWEDLLSEDPARIRRAWASLTDDECLAVLDHLRHMTEEAGWEPPQQQSAAAARQVIYEQAQ